MVKMKTMTTGQMIGWKTAGVDPSFKDSFQDFLDAGALRPRHISPRNLQHGVFRGGSRPQDIYRRIANGIEGTPMPSAPTLAPDEIWALVAFVRQIQFESVVNSNMSDNESAQTN